MSEYRISCLKPTLRLKGRGQNGQDEAEQCDHYPLTLSDSVSQSMRMRHSVHTAPGSDIRDRSAAEFAQLNVNRTIYGHCLRRTVNIAATANDRPMPATQAVQPKWSKICPRTALPTNPPEK